MAEPREKVKDVIRRVTREHLAAGGLAMGQCLTAVGWVGGTVPELTEKDGLVELPMSDVAGGYIVAGAALAGRKPIYIIRYQGFAWYNAIAICNYAAKSKDMWGVPCPMFVRLIGMDGGIGPVASGSHHGIFARMPGLRIFAPMTPVEYQLAWDYFSVSDDPVIVSEHRKSFVIDYEMEDVIEDDADFTLFAISSTRLNALEARKELLKQGIKCNVIHLLLLKPFIVSNRMRKALWNSKFGGAVLDGDFENGVAKNIAYDLISVTGTRIAVLALENKAAGFAPHLDNLPPTTEKICQFVEEKISIWEKRCPKTETDPDESLS